MAQELNLIEKSPTFHNPYVFKGDQQVKNNESSFKSKQLTNDSDNNEVLLQ